VAAVHLVAQLDQIHLVKVIQVETELVTHSTHLAAVAVKARQGLVTQVALAVLEVLVHQVIHLGDQWLVWVRMFQGLIGSLVVLVVEAVAVTSVALVELVAVEQAAQTMLAA
jgi:hypothetical protein